MSSKYKVGDKVRLKTWEELEKEFSSFIDITGNHIRFPEHGYIKKSYKEHMSGRTVEIELKQNLVDGFFKYETSGLGHFYSDYVIKNKILEVEDIDSLDFLS